MTEEEEYKKGPVFEKNHAKDRYSPEISGWPRRFRLCLEIG